MVSKSDPIENILDFGQVIFSVLVLAVSAGIAAHASSSGDSRSRSSSGGGGYGSRRWREAFTAIVCGVLVAVQLYYLVLAAQHTPVFPYVYDTSILKTVCLESAQGGKRSVSSPASLDAVNPCFCRGDSVLCFLSANDELVPEVASCPTDGSAYCVSNSTGDKIPLLVPADRGCAGGSGGACSWDEPCDPCDRENLPLWNSGRCRSCIGGKQPCNFITGVGPYCRVAPGSKAVQPCRWCCTEPEPLFANGTCY